MITDAQAKGAGDVDARAARTAALELRARAKFGLGDRTGARDDLRDLLVDRPTYTFTVSVTPRLTALLEEVRKATVGALVPTLEPADAKVEVDGALIEAAPGAAIPLAAGPHRIAVRKAGYKTFEQDVAIEAAASLPLAVTLERISAVRLSGSGT